jgi:hypothetical protein
MPPSGAAGEGLRSAGKGANGSAQSVPDDKLCAVPTKAFREALPRHRRLKIEGGAFFFTLVLADRDRSTP